MTQLDQGFADDRPNPDLGTRVPEPFAVPIARSTAPTVASLALLYLRHNDPARALALGLAAMKMGPVAPPVALLVATAFLRSGDPEQAAAALTRLERGVTGSAAGDLTRAPQPRERAAAALLTAKIRFRQGDAEGARVALEAARPAEPEEAP